MTDEHLEEQAGLYVLGVLTPEETRVFETALFANAELRQFVDSLRITRDALAGSVPLVTPPPALKQKILAQLDVREKVVLFPPLSPLKETRSWVTWVPWALAACLTLLFSISMSQQKALRQKTVEMAGQMNGLTRQADSLRNETLGLRQAVATLRESNQLQNVRVAVLNSSAGDSKAVAVSLWDDRQKRGVLVAQHLNPLPADRDYQLWVIDPKYPTPVSAGVFQADAQGNVKVQFKTEKLIQSANKFAVTEEPKGGLPTPTLKNLVMISD